MKQLLRLRSKSVVAVGISAAVLIGGGAAAYAATGTAGGTKPNASATKPKARDVDRHIVFGKVSSVTAPTASSSGTGTGANGSVGAKGKTLDLSGAGSITLTEPDGSTYTAVVLPRTKVYEYVAPGKKPVAEALTAVNTGDEVGVSVRNIPDPNASTASGSTSAPAPVHVATRILDLTGAVPSGTSS